MGVKTTRAACYRHFKSSKAFTLVELMLTMVISSLVIAAIYAAYISQQRTYLAQDQVVEMQQNIRAGLMVIAREIKMAGYDPTSKAVTGLVTILPGQLGFTLDEDGDGLEESVDFGFSLAKDNDEDRDGIPDVKIGGVPEPLALGRLSNGAGGYQSIAENIQAIEFSYLDGDGAVTAKPEEVQSVQISILARAERVDRNFTNTRTYTTGSGVKLGPYNDNYRRRMLITNVQLRNIGL